MPDELTKGDTPLTPPSEEGGMKSTEGEELKDAAETRIYEVGYLLLPTIAAEDVPREVTAIKDLLEKEGAHPFAEEFPRMRILAYPLRTHFGGSYQRVGSAYFGWIKFESAAAAAKRIETGLTYMERVIRFLLIKTVRENTMSVPRAPRPEFRREQREAPKSAPTPAPTPVSEAELDKSIEKLIAN